ncbi:MAG: adenine phosphoribosyltransferase [Kiritimatiellae bacterium]|nr:adenine phosphoribosyltransferase [Kiritimatiellia bacterium]MCO5045081.1 adenine phosphoribosyltransferase [Kiritimatiellia bacterium]MCO5062394.1 adenine phosphoribosyltransferase [Kiritimatiellia bacterium]MCO6400610.1 adenine phosphoribosyltransferase [Verrucomicrobiota bacterium]
MSLEQIKAAIRDVPDFPKPGILFKDITPLLRDPALFREVVKLFVDRQRGRSIQRIAAIESRGFLLGAAVAHELGIGLVPIRKKGKLPYETIEQTYELEYGSATIEVHRDAFEPGESVLLIDDLLATGGTALAAAQLIERLGARVLEIDFLIELAFLEGRAKLSRYPLFAPISF